MAVKRITNMESCMSIVDTELVTESELAAKVRTAIAGTSIAEIQELTQDTLDGLYAYAYDFYDKGRLDDAELFFKFLCIYDFYNPDYLKGYAAVCQLKKKYQQACDLYGISFSIRNGNDYSPIYLMGQCLLCMKKFSSAKECFETVISSSDDDILINKSTKYIELLNELMKVDSEEVHNE